MKNQSINEEKEKKERKIELVEGSQGYIFYNSQLEENKKHIFLNSTFNYLKFIS